MPDFISLGPTNYRGGFHGIDQSGNPYIDKWQDYIQSTYSSDGDGSLRRDDKVRALQELAGGRASVQRLGYLGSDADVIAGKVDAVLADGRYVLVDFSQGGRYGHSMVLTSGSYLNGYTVHDPWGTFDGTWSNDFLFGAGFDMSALGLDKNMPAYNIYYYE